MLIGIIERGSNLRQRLESIMYYEPPKRRFVWMSRAALATTSLLFLPMGCTLISSPRAAAQDARDAKADNKRVMAKTSYPQIVESIPQPGATDVDPNLTEIRVTFDRDMGKGMSWTGEPPFLPPLDQ